MSTTTSAKTGAGGSPRMVALLAVALPLLWFALMAASMVVWRPTEDALVVAPPGWIGRAPEGVAIVSAGDWTTVVRHPGPAAARRLYASGAWLVLPALPNGCLALSTRRAGSPGGSGVAAR